MAAAGRKVDGTQLVEPLAACEREGMHAVHLGQSTS